MDFHHAPQTADLLEKIGAFMQEHIFPLEKQLLEQHTDSSSDWRKWTVDPRVEELKAKARKQGLWNLFLPEISGLSHVQYAPLAELTGQSFLAPEIFNCNAPDSGNMELLWKYGSATQKSTWLSPLDHQPQCTFGSTHQPHTMVHATWPQPPLSNGKPLSQSAYHMVSR